MSSFGPIEHDGTRASGDVSPNYAMSCKGRPSSEEHPRHAASVVGTCEELRAMPAHVLRRPVRQVLEWLAVAVISPEHDTRGAGVERLQVASTERGTQDVSLDVEFRRTEPNARDVA